MHFLAALFILAGFGILIGAKSAIHEIEAFIVWLIAAVLACSASIVGAIERIHKEIIAGRRENKEEDVSLFLSPRPSSGIAVRDVVSIVLIVLLLIIAVTLLFSKERVTQWLRTSEPSQAK